MNLLADAHISRAICDHLTSLGHDCLHAERIRPGMSDAEMLRLAVEQRRIILTADKDFGELIFRQRVQAVGVILLRFRAASEAQRTSLFQAHWPILERAAPGHLVIVTNRRIRRTPLPA